MNYKFSEIVDITVLQELLESFAPLYPVATAILDVNGEILAASNWRRICTAYHRVEPTMSQRCLESDTALANGLKEQKEYNVYKCKNGLVDVAFPIIIDEEHLANFFIGQFLFEEPDREYFANQAKTFGFDTADYLQALDEVEVIPENEIKNLLKYFAKQVNVLALLGKANLEIQNANNKLEERVKERTNELEKTNSLLKKSQRIANLGIWELDLVNNRLNWSDEIFEIFEVDKEKFGASYDVFLHVIHPDDRDRVSKAYENSLLTREKYQITHRLLMEDGRIKWVEEQCETMFDPEGNPLKSIGTVYDISRLKQIEDELQIIITRQEALLKVQNVGFAFTKKRHFTWMNDVLEDMLGYEKGELIGKNTRVIYASEEGYRHHGKTGYPALARDGVYTQEVEFVKKDGTPLTLLVSMTALKKDLSEAVVVLVDVTETANLRKQLEQLNQNLQEQVKAEVAKNIEQKSILEQQAKMAEMGEMISAIAHQLKQPLNAISIGVQTIEDDILEGEKEYAIENLQHIDEQSRFMADTIDEFRNYFKKDTRPVRFNVKKAVESVLNILGYQLKLQSITMDISTIDANIDFFCNPNAFKQVILNLINNAKEAIKSNKTEGGMIEISCRKEDDSIRFSIQDNGGGIPEEIKEEIFAPYFTTKPSEGTGIGLSIIKSIVEEKMRGTIDVENRDGGALFTIKLPVQITSALTAD